ncbi:MAG: hypothetical protein HPY50_00335 [Firmicutes bacterium]|nr:hypothetical protein [Bacillota bacterium]
MWKVPKRLYIFTTGPFLLIGIGFIIAGFMASPEALTDDGHSLKYFYYSMGASSIFFPLLTSKGLSIYYKRINDRETNLIKNGIQGTAEILAREQTGTYINEQPQVKFLLLITIPGRPAYQIEHKDIVNLLDVGAINVGAKLPVFVDPNNEKNILLVYN